jgi:hypothetical protein
MSEVNKKTTTQSQKFEVFRYDDDDLVQRSSFETSNHFFNKSSQDAKSKYINMMLVIYTFSNRQNT